MDHFLPLATLKLADTKIAEEIILCNEVTKEYGLCLSASDVNALLSARNSTLLSTGRIEPGGSVVPKLIHSFCDSPYLSQTNYTEILDELIGIFYFYKNETLDLISDDELLAKMKFYFDGSCQGSLELLKDRELKNLADRITQGDFDFETSENMETQEDLEHE